MSEVTLPRLRARGLMAAATLSLALIFSACGPKDAEIKAAVDTAISGVSGITVAVDKGVATVKGEYASEEVRASTNALIKGVKGVKAVADSATVTPSVVISPDEALRTSVTAALAAYPTLSTTIQDGVVTLTGEVKRADLPKVMQALSALNPKKIENKATVKK